MAFNRRAPLDHHVHSTTTAFRRFAYAELNVIAYDGDALRANILDVNKLGPGLGAYPAKSALAIPRCDAAS